MNDSTYNGWTNYETWCVNLWIDNEEGSHIYWREQASECLQDAIDNDDEDPKEEATAELARRLESEHEGSMPELSGVWSDLLQHALGMTEWREIASNMLADSDVYSAGWNMPGYMPDESPSRFIDAEQARDYVADEIEREADQLEESEEGSDDQIQSMRVAAQQVRKGTGEYGETIGQYHYFVTKL